MQVGVCPSIPTLSPLLKNCLIIFSSDPSEIEAGHIFGSYFLYPALSDVELDLMNVFPALQRSPPETLCTRNYLATKMWILLWMILLRKRSTSRAFRPLRALRIPWWEPPFLRYLSVLRARELAHPSSWLFSWESSAALLACWLWSEQSKYVSMPFVAFFTAHIDNYYNFSALLWSFLHLVGFHFRRLT